jgi:hypothetical protein
MPEPDDIAPVYDATRGGIPTEPDADVAPAAGGDSPYVDARPAGGEPEGNVLDLITAELAETTAPVARPSYPLKRDGRYVVTYRADLDGKAIDGCRKASRDRKFAEGIDGTKFAGMIAAATCDEIHRDGRRLEDDGGRPLRFNHRWLLNAFGASTAADCAAKFYANDAELDAVARAVMTESGWGEEAQAAMPMDPSPRG